MIVILGAMQRSGSRWYFSMLNELVVSAGGITAREVQQRLGLEGVFLGKGTHLARAHAGKLRRLDEVSRDGHSFAIHTHRGANRGMMRLFASGRFKGIYICRDLRDVIVSALDRSRALHAAGGLPRRYFWGLGPHRSFARLKTVRGTTLWARLQLMPRWRAWMRGPCPQVVRYEDLVADPVAQMRRTRDYLGLDVPDERVERIVAMFEPKRGGTAHESLVRGVAGRYREALTPRQQASCTRWLRPYLRQMGYLD